MANQTFQDFFTYQAQVSSLAPGAQSTSVVSIQADTNFSWVKASQFTTIAGAAQTLNSYVIPLVTLTIEDSGSGRNLQDVPVPLSNIAGRGDLPFVLTVPRVFKANSSVRFTFTNISTATTYENIFLSLIGYKLFRF